MIWADHANWLVGIVGIGCSMTNQLFKELQTCDWESQRHHGMQWQWGNTNFKPGAMQCHADPFRSIGIHLIFVPHWSLPNDNERTLSKALVYLVKPPEFHHLFWLETSHWKALKSDECGRFKETAGLSPWGPWYDALFEPGSRTSEACSNDQPWKIHGSNDDDLIILDDFRSKSYEK